jgi:hypothetical protein
MDSSSFLDELQERMAQVDTSPHRLELSFVGENGAHYTYTVRMHEKEGAIKIYVVRDWHGLRHRQDISEYTGHDIKEVCRWIWARQRKPPRVLPWQLMSPHMQRQFFV